ncbi:MAG: NAD-dependent epimerase/dehydratase family protein [Thermoanaerobaculia bacterium]
MSSPTRRGFLGTAVAAGTLLASGVSAGGGKVPVQSEPPAPSFGRAPKPLSILILGGTGFIGPNQIRYAIERGHEVSMFNRGKTNPGLFPDVEHLEGDRNGQLDALKRRRRGRNDEGPNRRRAGSWAQFDPLPAPLANRFCSLGNTTSFHARVK